MKLYPNGILIQGLNNPTNFITAIDYRGASAYYQYPLSCIRQDECKSISNEISYRKEKDELYVVLEFISNMDLASRYAKMCHKYEIPIRTLFIESEYIDEMWHDPIPQGTFLGFEYCTIPFDSQIITDFDWYQPFRKFYSKLNHNGLFHSYADVQEFKQAYDKALKNDEIGDGDMDAYICRISELVL